MIRNLTVLLALLTLSAWQGCCKSIGDHAVPMPDISPNPESYVYESDGLVVDQHPQGRSTPTSAAGCSSPSWWYKRSWETA